MARDKKRGKRAAATKQQKKAKKARKAGLSREMATSPSARGQHSPGARPPWRPDDGYQAYPIDGRHPVVAALEADRVTATSSPDARPAWTLSRTRAATTDELQALTSGIGIDLGPDRLRSLAETTVSAWDLALTVLADRDLPVVDRDAVCLAVCEMWRRWCPRASREELLERMWNASDPDRFALEEYIGLWDRLRPHLSAEMTTVASTEALLGGPSLTNTLDDLCTEVETLGPGQDELATQALSLLEAVAAQFSAERDDLDRARAAALFHLGRPEDGDRVLDESIRRTGGPSVNDLVLRAALWAGDDTDRARLDRAVEVLEADSRRLGVDGDPEVVDELDALREARAALDGIDLPPRSGLSWDQLAEAFALLVDTDDTGDDVDVIWADMFVDHAATSRDVEPWEMTAADVEAIVFDLFPTKVACDADDAPVIIETLRRFVALAGRCTGRAQERTWTAVLDGDAVGRLAAELADESRFDPAKRFAMEGMARGHDLSTERGVAAWAREYNQRIDGHGPLAAAPPRPAAAGRPTPASRATKRKKRAAQKASRRKNR